MRKTIFFVSIAVLCAATSLVSCSNDDDTFVAPTEEGLTTITVGAPSITTDGGTTRVSFAYDNGLNISWEAGDVIKCTAYRTKDAAWGAGYNNREATADAAGATTTFTASNWDDMSKSYTEYAYSISYGAEYDKVETKSVSNSQTQAGNDNTAHLKDNYVALLKNVNTNKEIAFSSTWASDHAATKPISEGDECGKFIQSSCLKLDLTLPVNENLTQIKKVMVVGKSGDKLIQTKGGAGQNWTLTVTDLTSIDGNVNKYHFVGYIMLPPCDQIIRASSKWEIRVFYDDSNKIYKQKTFDSDVTIKAGTLAVIKLNSTGWEPKP